MGNYFETPNSSPKKKENSDSKANTLKITGTPASNRYGAVDKIRLKNIKQVYPITGGREHIVFDDMDFIVKDVENAGQFIVIVGESGCGKSTILNYITGLQQPTSGEIFFDGQLQEGEIRNGMIFQRYSSLPWYSVLENISLPLIFKGVERQDAEDKAMKMIKLVGLEGHENKYAKYGALSGGQLQRVAIARSFIANQEILTMDEPFGALDAKTKLQMQDLIAEIFPELPGDPTIILVTHDLSQAVYLADEIYVMKSNPGKVVEKIIIDLPLERDKSLKRTKKFLDYYFYLDDLIANMENC